MRIDIVSIFPSFFDALDISLLGKARQSGLIELGVHDLRDHTHDRHRKVDDTPFGGGAGMVMKPEPWGEALDAVLEEGTPGEPASAPVVIFPSPAGTVFTAYGPGIHVFEIV
jgi:tRNA (guanine37-N1)-methyltransferase